MHPSLHSFRKTSFGSHITRGQGHHSFSLVHLPVPSLSLRPIQAKETTRQVAVSEIELAIMSLQIVSTRIPFRPHLSTTTSLEEAFLLLFILAFAPPQ